MKKIFLLLVFTVLLTTLSGCKVIPPDPEPDPEPDPDIQNTIPSIKGVGNVFIYVGDDFSILEGVTAFDNEDGNLTSSIEVSGFFDGDVEGTYEIIYYVTDSSSETFSIVRVIKVQEIRIVYPTGFYNYKFANAELRLSFMAAAEKYLLNNMYAGIPLYSNASSVLFSSRLELPVEDYIAVMGFGTDFATMSEDDSTVLMYNGEYGNTGEYTFRGTISNNPNTFNHWLYDDSITATVIKRFSDSLYVYEFNEDKTGYIVVPSMAKYNPVPINPEFTGLGKEVSRTWQITLRDDLVWGFNEATNTLGYDMVIDANDFSDSYREALYQNWFRAISGGGDFTSQTNQIVNAQEFADGEVDWEDVGINLIDDLTIEFIFYNDMSSWDVRYWLSSFAMSPIQMDLYEDTTTFDADGYVDEMLYGTTSETTAYSGAYILDYYEENAVLLYSANPNFHSPDKYFYTHYSYVIIDDPDVRFNEFIDGKTEMSQLSFDKYEEYKTNSGLKQIPGSTVFRIMINGLGTVEAQKEQFPGSTWVPEPILAIQDFKMAMFFAIDRNFLANEVIGTVLPTMFIFSNAYLVDPENGIPYRTTEQGVSVGEGLSPETYGFDLDTAKEYYDLAINALIEDGTYTAGTAENPTIIEMDLYVFSGSDSQLLMGAFIKDSFEETFQNEEHHINVVINLVAKDFPGIYYDYMMIGEFDLAIGGISGATLDAASFLDTYSSDNRSGFTLNWGIDTSIAEIEIIYYDHEGIRHREMWSFDAISSVMTGEIFVANGEEAEFPEVNNIVVTPTTISFRIDNLNDKFYGNATYTLQYYDYEYGYQDVEGYIDIEVISEEIVIVGLTPKFDDYPYKYLGDYRIVIMYEYVYDEGNSGETVSDWFFMASIISDSVIETDTSTATFVLTLNEDDYARELVSVVVLNEIDNSGFDATILIVDLEVFLSDLDADHIYKIIFTFDDEYEDIIITSTDPEN